MKKKMIYTFKIVVLTVLVTTGVGMVSLSGVASRSPLAAIFGLQTAAANSRYGILGSTAPEFELDTWIDGDGNSMPPLRLGDYLGKVVVLYFFQDW
ncbi:hypothetical protein [Desulfosarcina sp.]|uniref:peroxiredoxin family protein n=1 Tax=Desulfosarcina sp. TaxID=2027861 RepID=UPI0029B836D9|nr:hypothetical protein [Desulfosarcina sp.]MDX2453447.1 hypothetical protein [Desulfosarcina sp.]MDX2491161.1 hypothetical protein [Desulfosarcina sp.]